MKTYIANAEVYTPEQCIEDAGVLIEDGRITGVGPGLACPPDVEVVDAGGLLAVPGFIDLQFNGGFGLDFTADPFSVWRVAAELPRHGVTAFLPTIITSPLETVRAAQSALLGGPPPGFRGARPLGLHLEGPFLNPARRGAHNPAHLRPPALEAIKDWRRDRGVWLVTLAPELPGALDLVRALRGAGVVVSAGHSLASFEEALAGFEAGIGYGTHLFNAMPPLDHRQPGLAAALLTDPRPVVGIIPDGLHVHPAVINLIWRARAGKGVSIVTDAMAALGQPPGRYRLGDFDVTVDGASARLPDGRLAGSLLSMDAAVRNFIRYTGCSLAEALAAVTTVPAALLGLSNRGRIAPGCTGGLVLLNHDLEVVNVYGT